MTTTPSGEKAAASATLPSEDEVLPTRGWEKIRYRLRANDAVWLTYHLLDKAGQKTSEVFRSKARERERAKDLPGVNTRELNRLKWTHYDWSEAGEEWTLSAEWRQSLIDDVMLAQLPDNASVLEIGPGGGRWSVELQPRVAHLTLADISPRVIEMCRERLAGASNVSYLVTDGQSLAGVADDAIDYVWSYDVFVHIAPVDQKGYLRELARVMKPGALAVVHHAGAGGSDEGWRSSMTAEMFADLLRDNGLQPLRQFERWGANNEFGLPEPGDVITVFTLPKKGK